MKRYVPRWLTVCLAVALTCSCIVGSVMLGAHHIRKNAPLRTNVFLPRPQSMIYQFKGGGTQTFTEEEEQLIYDAFCVMMTQYTECGGCGCGYWDHFHKLSERGGIQFVYDREVQYTGALPNSSPVNWRSMHFDTVNLMDEYDMFVSMQTDGEEHYLETTAGSPLGAHLNFSNDATVTFWAVVEGCLD